MSGKHNNIHGLILGVAMLIAGALVVFWAFDNISEEDSAAVDTQTSSPAKADNEEGQQSEVSEPAENTVTYSHSANLPDVTNGEVQGINTLGNASGVAQSVFNDDVYMLSVEFANLPDPVNEAFYEGWLVEPGTSNFFSTGVVEKDESGVYVDTYTDTTDWNQSHIRYVLTLEPNDNNPAPADHIVEANLAPIQ